MLRHRSRSRASSSFFGSGIANRTRHDQNLLAVRTKDGCQRHPAGDHASRLFRRRGTATPPRLRTRGPRLSRKSLHEPRRRLNGKGCPDEGEVPIAAFPARCQRFLYNPNGSEAAAEITPIERTAA
ncbi:hypothetical protein MRX96_014552 [Rhipicephalus microplus]